MRLTRIAGAELRRDPAALIDATKAIGFFAGPRAVLVEEAGDASAAAVARRARRTGRPGDARIVVTAGALGAGSALRKAFEAAPNAAAIGVYADPPGRDEIEAALAAAGLARPDRETMAEVEALAQALDPGDFAQFLAKLALYKRGDPAPLSAADLAACAPPAGGGRGRRGGGARRRRRGRRGSRVAFRGLGAAAARPGVTIAAGRYFRTLHAAACAADGPEAALARARPPVFGPRRSADGGAGARARAGPARGGARR